MRFSIWFIFLGVVIIQFLVSFYSQNYLFTDELYRALLGSKMTNLQFEDYLKFIHNWRWVGYLLIPLGLLLRITFIWSCLKIGSFITEQFTVASFWRICVQAEIIFLIGSLAGLLYNKLYFIYILFNSQRI
jgi:hypothetical protein